MKNILFIAYYFTRLENTANNRPRGILKYLPEYGYNITLLTLNPKNSSNNFRIIPKAEYGNAAIYTQVQCNTMIDLMLSKNDSTDKLTTDSQNHNFLRWKGIVLRIIHSNLLFSYAYKIYLNIRIKYCTESRNISKWQEDAIKLIEYDNINYDAIISTHAPEAAHIICQQICESKKMPWIADFRDLWSNNSNLNLSPNKYKKLKSYEITMLKNASHLTTVSQPLAEKLMELHQKPTTTINNGFDNDMINPGVELRPKFTITFTGYLYSKEVMDCEIFFRALHELIDEGDIIQDDVDIQFYGSPSLDVENWCVQYNLKNVVSQCGIIPKKEAIMAQWTSQILILPLWTGEHFEGILSGKIYEYLAAKRPILAVGKYDTGVLSILNETRAGVQVTNVVETKKQLITWYSSYKKQGIVPYSGEQDKIMKYSHKEMAKKFATILESIIDNCEVGHI